MRRRVVAPALTLVVLFVLELGLGRALAAREPLQALLTGQLWVVVLALAALGVRLLLIWVAPAWLAAACVEGWLARGAAAGSGEREELRR